MDKETQTMMLVPQGSLEAYIRAANEYPMLTAEEEKELAERLYYQEDIDAAKKTRVISFTLCHPCCPWLFRLWLATSGFNPRR